MDMMMKRYVAGLIASLAFLAASHVATVRAQSPPSTTTYMSLLSDGFEVKSALFTFTDDTSNSIPVVIVVTLQKGTVTERCWIPYATYTNGDTHDRDGRLLPMNCY